MSGSVLDCLPEILKEAREDAGASFGDVAVNFGRVENVIRRFEKKESAPKFAELDGLVAAYSKSSGVPVAELWMRVIERVSSGPEGNEAWQRAKALAAKTKANKDTQ